MEIKKLSIIITIILTSLVACNKKNQNNIQLVFQYESSEDIFENPLMCKSQGEVIYFGIPSDEMSNIDVMKLKSILVRTKLNNNLVAKAKPLEILNSNYPNSDSFFSLDTVRKTVGDYVHNDTNWFIIHNNPKNDDRISQILKDTESLDCSW